jgi:hypothetical protein
MVKRLAANKMLIAMAAAILCTVPLSASAHDHWGHGDRYQHEWHHDERRCDRDDWHRDRDDWHRGGDRWRHDDDRDGGRWIADALVSGAVEGLIDNAVAPAPRYYEAPPRVVYRRRVIYRQAPVVTRTIVYGASFYGRRYDDDDGD